MSKIIGTEQLTEAPAAFTPSVAEVIKEAAVEVWSQDFTVPSDSLIHLIEVVDQYTIEPVEGGNN